VKYVLAPSLNVRDGVFLDRLSSLGWLVFWILFWSGVFVWFLSPYSADFFMKNLFAQPINNDFTTSIFYEIKPQFL